MSYAKPTQVYVMGDAGGPIKVGASSRPKRRARALIWEGHARAMTIFATYQRPRDALTVERVALWLLREHRVKGEWFSVSPGRACAAIEEAIKMVDSGDRASVRKAKGRQRMMPPRQTRDWASIMQEMDEWARNNPEAFAAQAAAMGLRL